MENSTGYEPGRPRTGRRHRLAPTVALAGLAAGCLGIPGLATAADNPPAGPAPAPSTTPAQVSPADSAAGSATTAEAPPAAGAPETGTPTVGAPVSRPVIQSGTGSVDLTRTVSLNFKDIPITDVVRALADQAHTNIVTAGGVTGNVTLKLENVSLRTALSYITQMNKLAFAVDDPNHTIVVGTPEQLKAYFYKPSGPIVVTLAHASAADIATAVTKYFQDVQASPEGTTQLLMSGPTDEVTSAQQLIAALDVPPQVAPAPTPAPMGQAVLTLQTAVPGDIVTAFGKLYPRLTAVPQGAHQVLLSGEQTDVQSAAVLAQKLDLPPVTSAPGTETVTYLAHYADVTELQRILLQQVPDLLVVIGPGPGFNASGASGGGGASVSTVSGGGGAAGGSASGTSGSPSGTPGGGGASPGGGGGGASGLAMKTNLMLLTGTAGAIQAARELLARVDVAPPQVLLETRVVDVNLEHMQTIGVTWNFNSFGIGEATPASGATGYSIFPFGSGPLLRSPVQATLDLVANDAHNKVLASPKLLALSDRPADIFIGDEVHYVSNVDRTTTGTNVTTETENVGIDLNMLSHVEPDGQITLSVNPDVSVLTQFVPTGTGAQLPLISKRTAHTVMRVASGQTIAIGGLIQDTDLNSLQKVPFLGDLPFFGALFRHRQTTHQRSEVIIFITATVQPSPTAQTSAQPQS